MNINFEKKQDEVRKLVDFGNYKEGIKQCLEALESIEENNIEDDYSKWLFNIKLSICYKRLRQYKKGLYYAQKSILSNKTQDEYFKSIWAMANCFNALGNKKKALKLFEKCKDYFQRNNQETEYLYLTFNIAKLSNNERLLKEIIETYKKNNISESSVDNAYECLCDLYIKTKQYKKAEIQMLNIKNKNIIHELRNKIEDTIVSNIL